jgi:diguanylate cyclase (GGDEF)-like protein
VLCNSLNQDVIIAETNESSVARITEQLQRIGFNNFKFAANGAEIYKIIREYYQNPESIGLIIISEDLPNCQIKDLCKSFSHGEGGIFIPLIVLKKDLSLDCNDWKLGSQYLVYYLKQAYSSVELQMTVNFLILLKNEKYQCYRQQEKLLTELSERKLVDAKLKYLVVHDELTGLLNRSSLEQHIQLTLNRNSSRAFSQDSVLLFIDLDRFSLFNELEGFDVGDRLLIDVIGLIRNALNNVGLLARIDSDKFGLYLENCTVSQAEIWAEKIRTTLDNFRFVIRTIAYSITTSIGLSSLNSTKATLHPSELISQAHQACCIAKTNGRNIVLKYDSEDTVIRERHRDICWVPVIRDAFLNKRFFLVFQPVVNLIDGVVSHYEVLIRLRDEAGVVIGPSEFIPAAERMGLIHSIDLWVVERAIDYLAELPVELSHISLAINLSSVAFQDLSLLPTIKQKLEMTRVRAERLTFEITETAAIDSYKQTRLMINQIRALGCHFALDDFGAGFCSFNYLKKFPVDYVKIDGQFIQNLINDETDQMLVRSMHQIAKKMGKKTIAEFVECPKTISLLREIGVNYGQGYIFGKPSEQFLEQNIFQINDVLQRADYNTRHCHNLRFLESPHSIGVVE